MEFDKPSMASIGEGGVLLPLTALRSPVVLTAPEHRPKGEVAHGRPQDRSMRRATAPTATEAAKYSGSSHGATPSSSSDCGR